MRIQRKRQAGWRAPDGAVYVGRPTIWGNPFSVKSARECGYVDGMSDNEARRFVCEAFEDWLLKGEFSPWWYYSEKSAIQWAEMRSRVHELQGKTLMCWCPSGAPCHADVLLKFANESTGFFEYRYRG